MSGPKDLKFTTAAPLDAWVAAALADGWIKTPTYPDHEDVDRAFGLRRDGFHVMGLRRELGHPQQPAWYRVSDYQLCGWDQSGQAIQLPERYDFDAIKAAASVCHGCGKPVPKVHHVAFASKACDACFPEMKRKLEYPGWCD